MATRTDHSAVISEMREAAASWETAYRETGSTLMEDLMLSTRAAADLLEIHDATGLSLEQAPNLLAFVEHMMPHDAKVEPNGA